MSPPPGTTIAILSVLYLVADIGADYSKQIRNLSRKILWDILSLDKDKLLFVIYYN